jgi:hypothetical protein
MDYAKIDAALTRALNNIEDQKNAKLAVIVRIVQPLDATEMDVLMKLGIGKVAEDQTVFTANLHVEDIANLTDQSWVRYISLSRKGRLLINGL